MWTSWSPSTEDLKYWNIFWNASWNVYAGNIETLNAFYETLKPTIDLSADSDLNDLHNVLVPDELLVQPLVLNFGGPTITVGPYIIYNEKMVMFIERAATGLFEDCKIWIHEDYRLVLEMMEGKRILTLVVNNISGTRDFAEMWRRSCQIVAERHVSSS